MEAKRDPYDQSQYQVSDISNLSREWYSSKVIQLWGLDGKSLA